MVLFSYSSTLDVNLGQVDLCCVYIYIYISLNIDLSWTGYRYKLYINLG